VKTWNCDVCDKEMQVLDNYKAEICCNSFDCGCNGQVINPVICDDCQKLIGMGCE